jgi:4a-hydroxytetrahydrobiopterin dehydratase
MKSSFNIKNQAPHERRALSPTEIVMQLSKLDGWAMSGDGESVAIEKSFVFSNYFETLAFVNALAFIAHTQDHHPELRVFFNRCVVKFNTHDVKGISLSDFECAFKVDQLLSEGSI